MFSGSDLLSLDYHNSNINWSLYSNPSFTGCEPARRHQKHCHNGVQLRNKPSARILLRPAVPDAMIRWTSLFCQPELISLLALTANTSYLPCFHRNRLHSPFAVTAGMLCLGWNPWLSLGCSFRLYFELTGRSFLLALSPAGGEIDFIFPAWYSYRVSYSLTRGSSLSVPVGQPLAPSLCLLLVLQSRFCRNLLSTMHGHFISFFMLSHFDK